MWVLLVTAVFASLVVVSAILFKVADFIEWLYKGWRQKRVHKAQLNALWEDDPFEMWLMGEKLETPHRHLRQVK